MRVNTALQLAEHIHDLRADSLDAMDREAAVRCVLDLLGAAAAGAGENSARAALRASLSMYSGGSADIWFAGQSAGAHAALLANSAAAAALDLDDGHRLARGHPGAAVIPAAWTFLNSPPEQAHAADELLLAIVAGYETGIRMAMGRLNYAPSGAWAPYAVIAAAGLLQRSSPQTMAQAFGIAAQCAPALPGFAGLMGSDVKEGIAWGSATGLAALELAREGFTGPAHIFDEPQLFAADRICAGLGGTAMIHGIYFKPFACCRHAHAPVEAYLALAAQHRIKPADVVAVTVSTYRATFNLANSARPHTLVQAQYSVPFCIGAAAMRGRDALLPMQDTLLEDAAVADFAGRIRIEHAGDLEALFPARSPARVTITTRKATYTSEITDACGDSHTPFSWGELEAKFLAATRHVMKASRQQEILAGVQTLRDGCVEPLCAALRRPLTS